MRRGHHKTKGMTTVIASEAKQSNQTQNGQTGLLRRRAPRKDVFIAMLFVILIILFPSCHRTSDPLIGRWTVEKVNVEFNERIATPELVRQYGEIEKANIVEITQDSTLVFISDGDTIKGNCLLNGSQLFCDGKLFGSLEGGKLIAKNKTPIGTIEVVYAK